jgi:hypothetical protein
MNRTAGTIAWTWASIWRSLRAEIVRLNSGRLGHDALAVMTRRQRASAVKAALRRHHQHPSRCC